MHDLIFENQSDLDFLIYEEERLSYETVYHHASALAAALILDYGVGKGDRVFYSDAQLSGMGHILVCNHIDWSDSCSCECLVESE